MSAFKHNVNVEFSVHSLEEQAHGRVRAKASVKASALTSSEPKTQSSRGKAIDPKSVDAKIARAAPGLKPAEPRPVSRDVLASKKNGGTASASKINLATANQRGAALAEARREQGEATNAKNKALAAARPRTADRPSVPSTASASAASSSGGVLGPMHGLPMPQREAPNASRRHAPTTKRSEMAERLAASKHSTRPVHPSGWDYNNTAPDRDALMLQLDDEIDRKKHVDKSSVAAALKAENNAGTGVSKANTPRSVVAGAGAVVGMEDAIKAGAVGVVAPTPRMLTAAADTPVYAPHRIRSMKNMQGPVVNGSNRSLFRIAKEKAAKESEVPGSPRRRHGSSSAQSGGGTEAGGAGRPEKAKKDHHFDHDNVRNNVIHCDTQYGHMGIDPNDEQYTHGIHATPWNKSEQTLAQMDHEIRLLPAPPDRMKPMFISASSGKNKSRKGIRASPRWDGSIKKETSLSQFPDAKYR